jgi:hypothetical protein
MIITVANRRRDDFTAFAIAGKLDDGFRASIRTRIAKSARIAVESRWRALTASRRIAVLIQEKGLV